MWNTFGISPGKCVAESECFFVTVSFACSPDLSMSNIVTYCRGPLFVDDLLRCFEIPCRISSSCLWQFVSGIDICCTFIVLTT